ncbi:protein hinderin isoform X1 [Maylandia zebra]|uniref:Zgc:162344 n=1 Tax=Maylandia zebra TaxID=106582 RepID=A0A3P9DP64_9CICH|nr:protein hinderin isoform X1 [Maylandia zebra]
MAAAAKRSENSGIFWMNGVSDDERPLVFIPGVDGEVTSQAPFNLKPLSTSTSKKRGHKMGVKSTSDCKKQAKQRREVKNQSDHSGVYTKEDVSVHHNAAVMTPQTFLPVSQVISEVSKAKSEVCLKDLCPEDKRRIANLIEELARVSEEKEESVRRLKDEQGNFECKIQQLEQQNQIIAQERESLQQQYKECQELLGLYQQYISQQQAKLNQSIAQLSQPSSHSKVHSSEELPNRTSTSRANSSLFDGSYLSHAATGGPQARAYRNGYGRRGAVRTFRSTACLSCDGPLSPTHGPVIQHNCQKIECRGPHSSHRCECCECRDQGTVCGTQQQRIHSSSRLSHHDTFNQDECKRLHSGNIMDSGAKEALTRPLLGQEDWEEKRHQLLLQKMQLEMERERLHARLAEQEERLQRQNQQLQQSHLDYKRFQPATQAEVSSSNTRSDVTEVQNPSHQDIPSSVCDDAGVHPGGQSLHEKHPETVPNPLNNGSEYLKQPTKDMATSPAESPASLRKHTSVSAIQKTPDTRLDFSLVELLDIFSPVSAPEQCKTTTQRARALQHRPAHTAPKSVSRTMLTPGGPRPQSTQQDLEESKILEDIFFIC